MAIKYTHGDLLKAPVQYIVNTVNCMGVMGCGLALQVKKAYPENFDAYVLACQNNEVTVGKMFVHGNVINFPTKRHWRTSSQLEYIESGLVDLINVVNQRDIKSIAIPALGCGLGGLKWEEVQPLIVKAFEALPTVNVYLFEP